MSFKRVVSMIPIFERSRAAILLSCLIFLAAPAWGAVAFVQKVPNTTTATHFSGTSAQTVAITPTAGNLLVVVVTVAGITSPTNTVTVSDSDSVSYTPAGNATTSGGLGRVSIFYRSNVTAGAKTITITPSATPASPVWAVEVMEYFGVDTTPIVTTNSATGSSTTPTVSVTPTAGASLYIAATGTGNASPTSYTSGAGWTQRYSDPSNSPNPPNASEEISLERGTQTATWTQGASTSWVAVIATFSAGCTYNFGKSITVNSGQVSAGPHTNFPLLVSFTDANLVNSATGVTSASGYDIIFRASDGITQLDHEIERYTPGTGELVAWVRVPSINVGTVIYMYYGNSCVISPTQNPTGVWDANFKGVWHLSEATAADRLDSTSNNNVLTDPTSTAGVAGKIAGAADFVPTDYLTNTNPAVLVDATSTGLTTSASLNISHTVSGTNRLMLVGVSITHASAAPSVSSITSNGVPLTLVGVQANSDNFGRIEIWRLIAPPTGSNTVVITLSGTPSSATAGVTTFKGVNQSTPLGAFASATADSGTASVTVASAANELVFDTLVVEGSADKALAQGAGQTERWDLYQAPKANGGGSTEAGAASVVMSWTFSADKWSIGGVSIKPAAASTSLDLGTQFTLAAWVKGDEVTTNKVILSKEGTVPNNSYKLRFGSNSKFTLTLTFDGTTDNILNATDTSVAGTWYHVVGVYNSPTMYLYRNGALNTSSATAGGSVFNGTAPFNIGSKDNGTQPFDGIIDEARVSSVARSAGWILTEFNNQSAPGTFSAVGGQEGPGSLNAYETANYKGAITGVIMTKIAGATVSLDMIALTAGKNAIDNLTTTWSNRQVKVEVLDSSNNSGALDANNCRSTWASLNSANFTFPVCSSPNCGRTTISLAMPANSYPNARLKISYPTSSPTAIGCSTDNFAIRPNTFAGTTTPYSVTDTDWLTAGTTRTLNLLTFAATTPIHKAGRPFTVRATAVNAAGTPATTTLYTGAPTPTLTACVGAACTATFGTFTLGASFASGVLTSTVATYNNVGSFTLQLIDSTFSSVDAVAGDTPANCTSQYVCSATLNVGRFVPDHFAVSYNTPTFGTTCGSFTYIGQPFNYTTAPVMTVTAQNFTNGTTTLYNGAWMRITNTSLSPAAYDTQGERYSRFDALGGGTTPALDTSLLPATTADPTIAITNGVGTLTFGQGGGLSFTRLTPVAPFSADVSLAINVIDADNVAYESPPGTSANPARFAAATAGNGIAFSGGKPMRFGRLALGNALGSEVLNLPIPITTQYWNGTSFVTNTLDSCTTINANRIVLSNYQGALTSGNLPSGNISISGAFSAGVGNLKLTKPSSAVNGSVDLCVDLDTGAGGDTTCQATPAGNTYLQGAWAGTTYTFDPRARAAFGFSKGSYSGGGRDPFVYQRENY